MKPEWLIPGYVSITIWLWRITALPLVFLVTSGGLLRLFLLPFVRERFVPSRMLQSFLANKAEFINSLWNLSIENHNKFKNHKSDMIVSNHQSAIDIIVPQNLFKLFRWMSKAENFRLPLLGWIMQIVNGIELQRNNPTSFSSMVKEWYHILQTGCSNAFSPKVTCSEVGPVGKSAFWIASHCKALFLSMVLGNILDSLPRKGLIMQKKYRIRMKVLNENLYESQGTRCNIPGFEGEISL